MEGRSPQEVLDARRLGSQLPRPPPQNLQDLLDARIGKVRSAGPQLGIIPNVQRERSCSAKALTFTY